MNNNTYHSIVLVTIALAFPISVVLVGQRLSKVEESSSLVEQRFREMDAASRLKTS